MSVLSRSPDLNQLRKQAKDLLREFRGGDPRAHSRIAAYLPLQGAHSPAFADGTKVHLAQALFVIARENGFPSWPRLKASTLAAAAQNRTSAYLAGTRASLMPTLRASRQLARTQALLELSREVTELATRKDIVELTRRLVLPRRELLALRALIVERGEYFLLVDALLGGITHQSPRVRYDCVHALDHFADERCMEPLWHALNDPVPRVRRMALHVLS
jgi:HEAT repeats